MEPITLNWPGGEDEFLFRLGELVALDDKTTSYGADGEPYGGVLDFRWRLSLGAKRGSIAYAPVKINEILDCLRLGLIGAGMGRSEADVKVKRAFEDGDVSELGLTAYLALSHSLKGKDHDPVGEEVAEGDPPASSSPLSSETES